MLLAVNVNWLAPDLRHTIVFSVPFLGGGINGSHFISPPSEYLLATCPDIQLFSSYLTFRTRDIGSLVES